MSYGEQNGGPEEPEAWQIYDLVSNGDGSISGHATTNDDNDDGYPDPEIASWPVHYPSHADMLRRTGGTHTGCSGIHVIVFLDGKAISKAAA